MEARKKFEPHSYEVRPRSDRHGVYLISDRLPFGRLWYLKPDDAIRDAKFYSRSHDAVIRVYDEAGNVIQTHEPPSASSESHEHQSKANLVTSPPAVSTGDTPLVETTDALPANCNVYMRPTNCWFVLFHRFRQIATASFDTTKSANASQ
jgi:hypothetical protein